MYNYEKVINVLHYKSCDYSIYEISSITKIPKSSVHRWIIQYYSNYMNLQKRYIRQHTDKTKNFINELSTDIYNDVLEQVKVNPFITQKKLVMCLNDKFKLKINISKIKHILKHLGITKKKCKRRVVKSQDFYNKLIEKRKSFIQIINSLLIESIVSIDETGINSYFDSNLSGYSLKGESINLPVAESKLKNTSLLMALTTKGIISYVMNNNSTNCIIYDDFIDETIKKLNGKNFLFIFDNVSFHNNKYILKKITDSGNTFLFLPAYSPDLNPIENVNSIIKDDIKKNILNDYMNGNLYTKIKNEHANEVKENKEYNSLMILNEKNNLKNTIVNLKKVIKEEHKNSTAIEISDIKKSNEDKLIKNNKILEIKQNNKLKMKECIKSRIKEEKEKTKIRTKKNKKHCSSLIKSYIESSIIKFNKNYNDEHIKSIFSRAFTFNFEHIDTELKDRIIFLKS